MRHRKAGVKLNRTTSHRQAMFRNMVTSLFKYERIRTTDAKAKELRRWADNMVTLAKRGDLHARRQALAVIREESVVYKLFDEALERYGNINGGYTRIVKLTRRPGDAAPISMIELVTAEKDTKKTKKKAKPDAPVEPKVEETPAPEVPVEVVEESVAPEEAAAPDASSDEGASSDEEASPDEAAPVIEDTAADGTAPEEIKAGESSEAHADSADPEKTEPKQ